MHDLRYAFRQLLKAPDFTCVAVLTLALGIGANTAIFSVINGVLLRPLPYDQPEQLMRIYHRSQNFPKAPYAAGGFFSVRTDNQTFETITAWQTNNFNLYTEGAEPERIEGAAVTDGFLRTLKINPVIGRDFKADEFAPGQDGAVIISYTMWQQRFGGARDVLGRTLQLNGRARQVIGVAPDQFNFPGKSQLWAPFAPDDFNRTRRDLHNLQVMGRLKPGVTAQQAQADLAALTTRYAKDHANTDADWACVTFPMLQDAVGQIKPALLVLVASVIALLLIACANVTNLLLARAASRRREMAVRAALGAGRGRIVRQLVIEALALFGTGGIVGALLGAWLLHGLLAFAPANIPRLAQVSVDWRVLAVTSTATLLTGLICGLVPAWQASRTQLTDALRAGGHGSTGKRGWLRNALVVLQVAATVMLLICSGLLIRSFHRLQQVDAGFDPSRVMTMRVDLPLARYTEPEKRRQFVTEIVRRLGTLPGVQSAAVTNAAPLTSGPTFIMRIEGAPAVTPSSAPVTRYRGITPDYFNTMGIALLRGRQFTSQDVPGSPRVVIINQAFARKFFPGVENPVGKRIEIALDDPPRWGEIVGVVADVKIDSLEAETPVQTYEPYHEFSFPSLALVLRASGDPLILAAAMRREVLAVDPQQPVHTQKTMEQLVTDSLGQRYFSLLLVATFAVVALTLAIIGLYGVIAYNVVQRTREFGVRLAIGAGRGNILALVLADGVRLVGLGVILGVVGALFSARLMQSLLFGVGARDPLTYVLIPLILGSVGLLACLLPARRATKVDPIIALRAE
ncbi:ABC transporter permease [Oleiharenicola lentus]|uniref:ABC transporter permease n=1 Tax=Oleiharenicola lentus TaxID=2508720 RepID=UPI003F674B89